MYNSRLVRVAATIALIALIATLIAAIFGYTG